MSVGSAAGNAVLDISGSLTANNIFVGNFNGAVGAVYQSGGTVTATFVSGGADLEIGNIAGGYGYYDAIGGTLTVNGIGVAGEASTGNGIMEINGATVNDIDPTTDNNPNWFTMGRTGSGQTGVLNMFHGSLSCGILACNFGSGQTSIINILGGSINSSGGVGFWGTGGTGILNLNGGLLSAYGVGGFNWYFDGSMVGRLNFNGGTLQASGEMATSSP